MMNAIANKKSRIGNQSSNHITGLHAGILVVGVRLFLGNGSHGATTLFACGFSGIGMAIWITRGATPNDSLRAVGCASARISGQDGRQHVG